jgi:threonine/homoserine/homoserine lactone efflux protein
MCASLGEESLYAAAMLSMLAPSLIAFCIAAALLTVTPGLDTALVLRTSVSEGRARAFAAGLGVCLGCLVWSLIVALGLGALLVASEVGYAILKWVGAGYLLWLGIQLLRRPRAEWVISDRPSASRGTSGWLLCGFLTNMLNPKVGVFYVSFLPQFVPPGVPLPAMVIALGAIHAVMGVLWFALLIGGTHRIATGLRRPAVLTALDRLTGAVFVAFGLRLAFEARR